MVKTASTQSSRANILNSGWFCSALIAGLTVLAYLPATKAGFIWDDDDYVTNNALLTAPDGLRRIWFSLDSPSQYFPLVYTTFRMERGIWDLNPAGYHWLNILLHVANALLLWRLLGRLKVPWSFLGAMIFALHPVQAESVAWVSERKNVLMGIFFLFTLLNWISFLDEKTGRRWRFYSFALLTCFLALCAKTTACTLPVAMLLILWLQRRTVDRHRLAQIAPFVVLASLMGLVTMLWERFHIGTQGKLFALSPLERLLVASRNVWFYLAKLFWPAKLTFIYPRWQIPAADPLAYTWLIALIVAAIAILLAPRLVRRSLAVSATYYVATLGPTLGFIMLYTFRYTFVADHYQYLATIGPIALVTAALGRVSEISQRGRAVAWTSGFLLVALLAALTWRQTTMYRNLETLWQTTIARNPDCWLAYNNLGAVLKGQGNREGAKALYLEALKLKPDFAEALTGLGVYEKENGDIEAAIEHYQAAIRSFPNYAAAHFSLGNALAAKGDQEGAIAAYKSSLEIWSDDPGVHNNLAAALIQSGRIDEAIDHLTEAVRLKPSDASEHYNLGFALTKQHRFDEAIVHFRQAVQLNPDDLEAKQQLRALEGATSP